MKADNYITIQGWMITELKLSGNELITYALIYGFSQDGESVFTGSINYVCGCLNCTRPTASKALDGLASKGLITKIPMIINGVKFNKYAVVKDFIGSKESLHGVVKNLSEGSKESLHNNTNNKDNNINIEVESPKVEFEPYKKYTQEEFKVAIFEANKKISTPLINSELKKFYDYWSETNQRGVMRFQLQQTWKTTLRLATWRDRFRDVVIGTNVREKMN